MVLVPLSPYECCPSDAKPLLYTNPLIVSPFLTSISAKIDREYHKYTFDPLCRVTIYTPCHLLCYYIPFPVTPLSLSLLENCIIYPPTRAVFPMSCGHTFFVTEFRKMFHWILQRQSITFQ